MAKKARFFKTTTRDGYGDKIFYYPAQSSDDLWNSLRLPPAVQLISIDHLGWFDVSTGVDENIEYVRFFAVIEGVDLCFDKGDLGYEYLWQLFPKKAAEESDFINNYHGPR